MTQTQSEVLKDWLALCAKNYNNAPLINLGRSIVSVYEKNENNNDSALGNKIADAILESNFIAFPDRGLEVPFREFWVNAVTEVKSA